MVGPQRRRHAVSRAPDLPAGGGGVAASAARRHESHRPVARPSTAVTRLAELVPRWRPQRGHDVVASGASGARRGPLWRQVPVYSPLTLDAAWRAATQALSRRDDPRPRVERLLRALYPAREAVLLGSGTHALGLAIRVAVRVVGEPCVVALPAFSCYDVATAAVGADVHIALYDVDPWTLAPDLDSVTATLAEGARVVVVAPLFGIPVDWDAIEHCLAAFGALAIEDAAQGHGARWRGSPLGSRSEEHTSELQSPCNLVCRLLLEKKKSKGTRGTQLATDERPPTSN